MDGFAPDSVVRSRALDVRISSIYLERHLYDNYPPFQRDKVWPDNMKRYLIDSILRGFYIPAILVYTHQDEVGMQRYWVIDGQQRLSSILEFMDDLFPTMRRDRSDEPNYQPIEPNKFYSQLSPVAKNRFQSFTLHFRVLEDVSENLLGVMFRRLQYQQRLTSAEKLWSYTSKTTNRAIDLCDHEFWNEIYFGNRERKHTFQASLYLIFLELFQGFVNVTTPRLKDLASGAKDAYVDARLIQTIRNRLDIACHIFAGSTAESMIQVIPIYQAILFLQNEGYDLVHSQKGCLTEWFKIVREDAKNQEHKGFRNTFYEIDKTSYQRQFWEKHLPIIRIANGLVQPKSENAPEQTQLALLEEQSEAELARIEAEQIEFAN